MGVSIKLVYVLHAENLAKFQCYIIGQIIYYNS